MKKYFYLSFSLLIFLLSTNVFAVTKTFSGAGNWSSGAWIPAGAPATGDDVVIPGGTTCTVDINTNIVNNVQVDGTLLFVSSNASDLKLANNLIINNTGVVNNTGSIEQTNTGLNKLFNINLAGTYIHNPFNNVLLDESIFYTTSETFSPTSNLIIMKWFDISIPLGDFSRVQTSNFGNVTLSVNTAGLRWNQKGNFGPNRIKGTFTITDGIILMDDGQGSSVSLTLQTVNISNTGSLIVRSGSAPSFNLITGTFTDNSTSLSPTVLADTTFCLYQWAASGNVTLGHLFYGMVGTGTETGGDLRITVATNLTINGTSSCQFVTQCDAPFRLTVTNTTTISGAPTKVRFLDGNTNVMIFTTNDFIISGGADNVLLGGGTIVPKATGIATVTINQDFLINGASSTYILNSDTNLQKLRVVVGRDFIMSNAAAQLVSANHLGAHTFKTTGLCTINGGSFTGELDTLNVSVDSVIVGSNYTFNCSTATNFFKANASSGTTVFQTAGNFTVTTSGTAVGQGVYGIYQGSGALTMTIGGFYTQAAGQCNAIFNNKQWVTNGSLIFTVTGMLDQNGGFLRGIYSTANSNPSIITFNVNSVDFDGGYFSAYHTANNNNGVATFNITNNCKVNFAATTDSFMFVGVPYVTPDFCYLTTNVTIGGSLIISGANGAFVSSYGKNGETFNITGSVTVSAGNNSFNPAPAVVSTTHNVTMNVGGSMTFTGGTTFLSALNDTLMLTVTGDLVIAGGSVTMKGKNGVATANVLGAFNMTGGSLFLHNNTVNSTSDAITLTINSDGNASGDFTHTGGTITFDNNASGNTAQPPTIIVKSPNYTIGGNGIMTNAIGAAGYTGSLRFQRNGTINFVRSSVTHNIQQVRQYIDNGTTVDVSSGNVQISSWNSGFVFDLFNIMNTGTLALRGNSIKSNVNLPYSGITVYGRLKTQHPNGFYNNTAAAALDATGQMTYWLQVGSTVEYYGSANQIISGFNIGLATIGVFHKYYNLDINMSGVAFAYPTNTPNVNSVFIRNHLNLLAGELNLDNDHVTANGGRAIILEDSTTAAISRAAGFIRSETEDGSGLVKWVIKRGTGAHTIPFGYTVAAADLIPFIFDLPSGNADTVMVSTYHTNNLNLPYPPTVTHVRNNAGVDNSANTVDRFWYLKSTGTAPNANLTFVAMSAGSSINEMLGITVNTLRAQRWIPAVVSWEFPYQGAQSNPVQGTLVTGATSFPNWWTLSGNNSPLPVQLLSFSGNCKGKNLSLKWTTASEINNDHFTINRSKDGVNYEPISTVLGHGNSTVNITYEFTDEKPLSQLGYYKLMQTDYDGHYEEFNPIIVSSCKEEGRIDVVVANSETGNTNLLVQSSYSGNFHLDVLNSQGQVIISTETFINEGSNLLPLATDRLSTGIYHVRLQGDTDMISKKVFINKN